MMRLLHEEGCDCYPHPEKTYPHEILTLPQKCKRLTPSGESRLYRLEKDHEGEREFAKILFKELHQPYITLYGIMLEHNESHFQIDCKIISQGTIYLIDIKYFSQEYYYHNDDFYLIKTKEKTDTPLHQLERCKGAYEVRKGIRRARKFGLCAPYEARNSVQGHTQNNKYMIIQS